MPTTREPPTWHTRPRSSPIAPTDTVERRVLEVVRELGWTTMSTVQVRTGHGWNAIMRAFAALERAGLTRRHATPRMKFVYAPDARVPDFDRLALLHTDTARSIAAIIIREPAIHSLETIAAMLDVPTRVVHHHAKRLRAAGLLTSSTATRYRALAPAPGLAGLLAELATPGRFASREVPYAR